MLAKELSVSNAPKPVDTFANPFWQVSFEHSLNDSDMLIRTVGSAPNSEVVASTSGGAQERPESSAYAYIRR